VQDITGLPEVIPNYLAAACPALRTLSLISCTFEKRLIGDKCGKQQQQQQQQAVRSPTAPPLQVLAIVQGFPDYRLSLEVLTDAIASLPHLNSLVLDRGTVGTSNALC
jgi:hypothetical protein